MNVLAGILDDDDVSDADNETFDDAADEYEEVGDAVADDEYQVIRLIELRVKAHYVDLIHT